MTDEIYCCGLCDRNFKTRRGCDNHFKSPEHLERVTRWYELCAEDIAKNGTVFGNMRDNAKKVLEEEREPERVEFG